MLSMTIQATNMRAIGVYILTLRDALGLTRDAVADASDTTETTVYRYERGEGKEPEMPKLFRVVAAVRGRGDDIMKLVLADNPTDDYARALAAEAQLTPEQREQVGQFTATDADSQALFEAARDLSTHNKALVGEAVGYINGLKARASQPPSESPPKPSRRQRRA